MLRYAVPNAEEMKKKKIIGNNIQNSNTYLNNNIKSH